MNCPRCGLSRPENAQRCDCGYEFESRKVAEQNPIKIQVGQLLRMAWHPVQHIRGAIGVYFIFAPLPYSNQMKLFGRVTSDWREYGFQRSDWIILALYLLASIWFWLGVMRVALDAVREKPIQFARLMTPLLDFLRILLVLLVYSVCVMFGALLLILPGIYLYLAWSQAIFSLVDGESHLFDSFAASKKLMNGANATVVRIFLAVFMLQLPAGIIELFSNLFTQGSDPTGLIGFVRVAAQIWSPLVSCYLVFVQAALYKQLLLRAGGR